ncbi:hypothetical protein [Streptomyces sp. MJP52]|uniref:VG15 protein n=1 Tax=Streptomyces sp. MJP52 TaxID=2940555 RepID=UPI002476701E|nr:hypothetical protein [Streptomyces sp. MJP52]MDH6224353.1 hypothetical protein [Streptomyces sp. MJP52]
MATTVSDGGEGAARYRSAQVGLTRLLVRDVRGLRRLILPQRLRESVPDWLSTMQAVVDQYARASAGLAAEFYDAQRDAAGVGGPPFTVPVADPPPPEQTEASLRWAVNGPLGAGPGRSGDDGRAAAADGRPPGRSRGESRAGCSEARR